MEKLSMNLATLRSHATLAHLHPHTLFQNVIWFQRWQEDKWGCQISTEDKQRWKLWSVDIVLIIVIWLFHPDVKEIFLNNGWLIAYCYMVFQPVRIVIYTMRYSLQNAVWGWCLDSELKTLYIFFSAVDIR